METTSESEGPTPAKKPRQSKVRPSEVFKNEYAREFSGDMIKASTKGNGFFFCGLCKTDNAIGKKGKGAITRHNASKAHRDAKKSMNATAPMDLFVTKGPSSSESDKNSIVEATIAYHIVKHHQGFVQADCMNELLPSCFKNDAKLYKVGQTKAKAIVCNVLSPHFLEHLLSEFSGRKFSLMNVQWTDERNSLKLGTVSSLISLLINSDCISCLRMFNYLQTVEGIAKRIGGVEEYNV